MEKKRKFYLKALLSVFFLLSLFISSVYSSDYEDCEIYGVCQDEVATTITTILSGNLTNLSQLFDTNINDAVTNDNDVLTWDDTAKRWIASAVGALSKWVIDVAGEYLYNDSTTLFFNTTKGNATWCTLTGCNMTGDINLSNNNINNIGNATINQRLFFGDINHFIKIGAGEQFGGISDDTFWVSHEDQPSEGTTVFLVSSNKTRSDIDAINILAQIGRNNSAGILGNSWQVMLNNLTSNLTIYSNCFLVANLLGKQLRVLCDSSDTGADFIVQDDIQAFGTGFFDGGLRAETLVDFIMDGEDVNIQNGSIHIFTPITFLAGVTILDEVTTFIEDFVGSLGRFNNLQTDNGNWFATTNILCDDGDCANSIGISGAGNIIMQANISTVNINSTTLNFVYSLSNVLGSNNFSIKANNNIGGGEVTLFSDATNNVIKSSQSVSMPSSMWNQPNVGLRFECDVTQANRECFVDTIKINGTAIATTLTNQSGFNSVIKFGDGVLAGDGFPERGIIYNASADQIIFRGNVTFELITEQDLNITNSITLNSSTIFDWAGVVTSPNFPSFLLANGSRALTGQWNYGSQNINGSGNLTARTGVFTNIGSDLIPTIDSIYDLGSATNEWKRLFIDDTAFIDFLDVGLVLTSLIPSPTDTYDLGSSTNMWKDLYISGNLTNADWVTANFFNGSGANLHSVNITGLTGNINNTNINVLNVNASSIDIKANLTLGQKITFALGEIIDNLVDGWITITGGLNVTGNAEFKNATFMGMDFIDRKGTACNPLPCKTWCTNNTDGVYLNDSAC